jgi:hypothetical protein
MNNSFILKWLVCFLMLTFCLGILSLTPSVAQEKKAISTEKDGVIKQQPEAASANQPEIVIETKEYDAGEVYEGDEVVHSFVVKNKGKGELQINKVKPG